MAESALGAVSGYANQTYTIEFTVPGDLDGTTLSPPIVVPDSSNEDPQQIYRPDVEDNLGLIDVDYVVPATGDGRLGARGPRVIHQVWIDSPVVGAAGAAIQIVDDVDGTPTVQQEVDPLVGVSTFFRTAPFWVPQGSMLRLVGFTNPGPTPIKVRLTIEDPVDLLAAQQSICGCENVNGNTLQAAYDLSAGADPSIQLSAANGPFILGGDAAVPNTLELDDAAGVQVFSVSLNGNVNAAGTLDVAGATTLAGILDVTGATTMAGILDVTGDATFESDVILDGTVGNGDLSLVGDLTMNSASPVLLVGNQLGAPTIDIDKLDTLVGALRFLNAGVLEAQIRLVGNEDLNIVVGAFSTGINNGSGRWTFPADVRIDGNDLLMPDANPRLTMGTSAGGGAPMVRAVESVTATPPSMEIRGGNHTGVGAGNFDGTTVLLQGGNTTDTGAGASPGGVTVRVGTTAGGGAVPAIELEAATNITGALGVTGDATMESDLILDGAIGSGDLTMAGDFAHEGTRVGFYNAAVVAQSAAYTLNAVAVLDRTLLESSAATTLNNNNALAALISDLQATGLIG